MTRRQFSKIVSFVPLLGKFLPLSETIDLDGPLDLPPNIQQRSPLDKSYELIGYYNCEMSADGGATWVIYKSGIPVIENQFCLTLDYPPFEVPEDTLFRVHYFPRKEYDLISFPVEGTELI